MMSLGSRNVNTRSAVKSLYIRSQVLDVLVGSELLKLVPRPLGDGGGVGSKKSAKCETLDVAECGEASDVLSHWGGGRLYLT